MLLRQIYKGFCYQFRNAFRIIFHFELTNVYTLYSVNANSPQQCRKTLRHLYTKLKTCK